MLPAALFTPLGRTRIKYNSGLAPQAWRSKPKRSTSIRAGSGDLTWSLAMALATATEWFFSGWSPRHSSRSTTVQIRKTTPVDSECSSPSMNKAMARLCSRCVKCIRLRSDDDGRSALAPSNMEVKRWTNWLSTLRRSGVNERSQTEVIADYNGHMRSRSIAKERLTLSSGCGALSRSTKKWHMPAWRAIGTHVR